MIDWSPSISDSPEYILHLQGIDTIIRCIFYKYAVVRNNYHDVGKAYRRLIALSLGRDFSSIADRSYLMTTQEVQYPGQHR